MNKNEENDKNNLNKERDLKKRTKAFAIRIIRLVQHLNEKGPISAKIIANRQLLRSGTAVVANYRAACRCKSRKDFISKMGTEVEECDETQLWLELLIDSGLVKLQLIHDLLKESGELTAIMTKSKGSAIKNQSKNKDAG
ncbi:MAG: four helix bundle protein [Candidatus Doudnabacteria bacterium CG10_big_fil_rev_8_21_14_0_10_42_18]|uniref:Four helix bundle protein n=1 Tax=Candidatus Doudnabacteria bacterium CG10_big_fil_rev_8_21_14_0_10_42_18 TaxID=1974552 RepID=A0A2H0VBQ9_9BACT|nr:MAG: four helix bundle protein [Candidatus Doudnabacteria bacterium CG10_big_fil_rev_8_21_14_0_10_42_18]